MNNQRICRLLKYQVRDPFDTEKYENVEKYNPDILKIINYVKNNEPTNPHAVNPEYLKLTEAEEKLNDNKC